MAYPRNDSMLAALLVALITTSLADEGLGGHFAKADEVKATGAPDTGTDPSAPAAKAVEKNHKWAALFSGALTSGAKSSYDITINSIVTTTKEDGKNSAQFAGSLEYEFSKHFSLGGEVAYSPYKYNTGNDEDKMTALSVVPRLRFDDPFKGALTTRSVIWVGVGLGYQSTSIGGDLSGGSSSYILSIPNRDVGGGIVSPRFGADAEFENWLFRVEFQYVISQFTTPYTLSNATTHAKVASGDITARRSWWVIGLGVGGRFDF